MSIAQYEPAAVRTLLDSGKARLFDVREPDEFRQERIAGSTLAPLSNFNPTSFTTSDQLCIIHCKSGKRGTDACNRLLASGCTNIAHLQGGIEAWKAAGLPVVKDTSAPMTTMQQTQIAMGLLVVITTALGAFVTPWALVATVFVGCGMIFAGLSGSCAMANIIAKLPWNRTKSCTSCATGTCKV